jgi:hypothetical protein
MKPINVLQRGRRERPGCNRCVPLAGSLSLGPYPAGMVRNFPEIDRGKSAEPMPFDCERIVYRGVGRLITKEK